MATRTAKGTANAKASGTGLDLAGVACDPEDSLIAGYIFDGANPPDTVTWGARALSKVGQRIHATPDFGVAIYHARRIHNAGTRTLTATWGASIGARAMFAITLDSPHVRDEIARSVQTDSSDPTVGPTAEHDRSDCFALGILGSEGPSGDTAPSISGDFAAGHRSGTVGAPPVGNKTLLEVYNQLTSSVPVTASGTGATSRDWCNIVVAFRPAINCVTDVRGNPIETGDNVIYEGVSRVVDALRANRNQAELSVVGWVNASEIELLN